MARKVNPDTQKLAMSALIESGIAAIAKDGNQLASSLDNEISKTWLRASYSLFDPANIRSDEIKQVAFEIRKN